MNGRTEGKLVCVCQHPPLPPPKSIRVCNIPRTHMLLPRLLESSDSDMFLSPPYLHCAQAPHPPGRVSVRSSSSKHSRSLPRCRLSVCGSFSNQSLQIITREYMFMLTSSQYCAGNTSDKTRTEKRQCASDGQRGRGGVWDACNESHDPTYRRERSACDLRPRTPADA